MTPVFSIVSNAIIIISNVRVLLDSQSYIVKHTFLSRSDMFHAVW